jgi:hypothetical protein
MWDQQQATDAGTCDSDIQKKVYGVKIATKNITFQLMK